MHEERDTLGAQFDPNGKALSSYLTAYVRRLERGSAERAGAWSGEEGHGRDAIRSRVCYVDADVVSHSEADQGGSSSAPRSGN